jgi:ligand-binding sensor domain-containing protein
MTCNKKQLPLFIIICLFVLLPESSTAQKYLFDIQHISIEDGLPNRNVHLIKQDKEGFIWGSGSKGLFRYDGYEFDTYNNTELGVKSDKKVTFFPDDEGLIWYRITVYKSSPVYILNPVSGKSQSLADFYKEQLPPNFNNKIIRLHDDSILGIIFITKEGHFFSCKSGKITRHYSHYSPLENATLSEFTYTSYLVADTTDNYWFYHQDTIFHVLPDKSLEHTIAPYPITDIFKLKDGLHLIYGPSLDKYKRNRKYFATLKNKEIKPYELPSIRPNTENCRYPIVEDKLDFKWHKELNEVNKTVACLTPDNKVIFEQSFLDDGKEVAISSIYVDKQNNCWVATEAGIYKITRQKISFKTYLQGYSVRGIYKWKDTLIVNTWDVNSTPIRAEVNLKTDETALVKMPVIRYVFHKSANYLWIGSNENILYRKNLITGKTDAFKSSILTSFISPYQFENSERIWIGTSTGLVYFDTTTATFTKFQSTSEALNKAYIFYTYATKNGTWLATSHGLFLTDKVGNILKTLDKTNDLPSSQINFIHRDKAGIYWIAIRDKGLVRWNEETDDKLVIGRKQGFLNENIYAIFEDDYGFLWLPTDYGLVRFNKKTFEVNTYLPKHGLLHEEFNTYSYYQDKVGNFYFGGLNGVISFHPKDIVDITNTEVPLHFKKIKVLKNNEVESNDVTKIVQIEKLLTIRPEDKLFEIYFTLMDFKKKDKLYAYKIEGYDTDWNYTTDNFIRINTLPYGTYQLKIKGQIDGITWTKTPLILCFAPKKSKKIITSKMIENCVLTISRVFFDVHSCLK